MGHELSLSHRQRISIHDTTILRSDKRDRRKKDINYDKTWALTFVASTVTLHTVVMSRLVDDNRRETKIPVLRVAGCCRVEDLRQVGCVNLFRILFYGSGQKYSRTTVIVEPLT